MSLRDVVLWLLVAPGALLVFVCALGLVAMRDPYQRLHFIAPPATLSATLFAAAAIVEEPQFLPALKRLAFVLLVGLTNGVATHAIARAARTRELGRWLPPEVAPPPKKVLPPPVPRPPAPLESPR